MIKIDLNQSYWKGYIKGHTEPFWLPEDYTDLPYIKQETTIKEEVDEWVSYGYPRDTSFTGYMYSSKNPMPAFIDKFKSMFSNIENMTFTLYKMQTMDVMPVHVDHFNTYMKLFNVEREKVIRILVMLEDWKPGHYLEIDGEGITNWKAGDYYIWKNDVPHAASNIGKLSDLRYTLQITATLIEDESHFYESNKLYQFNIPSSSWIIDSHLIKRINDVINNNNGMPYIVYTGNENIKELEKLVYPEDIVKQINGTGLDIYLYEPLCSYLEGQGLFHENGTKHTEWFYSEFNNDVDYNKLRADELDSIVKFQQNNNIHVIRVHTCDYDVEKYYPYYNQFFQLLTDDICLKTRWYRNILDEDFFNGKLETKFLSLNYRYTFHRQLVASYLAPMNSRLSWPFKCDIKHYSKTPWYDINNQVWKDHRTNLILGSQVLNDRSPWNLDFNFAESTVLEHHYLKPRFPQHKNISKIDWYAIEKFYKDVFVEVVNETRYAQPTANFSEKVHQPMFYLKPFILVAPPYTLKYLREFGFKTFDKYWDESYDTIENHEERLVKIFDVIHDIDKLSIEQCNDIYQDMMPILQHNQKLLRMLLRL